MSVTSILGEILWTAAGVCLLAYAMYLWRTLR